MRLILRSVVISTAVVLLAAACTGSPGSGPASGSRSVAPPVTSPTTQLALPSFTPMSTAAAVQTVLLSKLQGATVPTTFLLEDDTKGVTEAKFFLTTSTKTFLYSAHAAPFETAVSVQPGPNSIEVRHDIGSERSEVSASFTARSEPLSTGTLPPSSGNSASPAVPPTVVPTVRVSTATQLAAALGAAGPGTVIQLADGVYVNGKGQRWTLSKSGTAQQPIVLEGDRGAILESDSVKGDYGLWITGSYWRVLGLSIRNASKGIVLDHSQYTVIDGVEVSDIGDEGVHFRTCSSHDVLQNSFVHDTGVASPNFGEGVYVGSANSNWSKYACQDGQDKSEDTLIRGNTFVHIAAEGADLKEGTDSGTLTGNTFTDTGYSGANSADSAVDAKGNNWTISGNLVSGPYGSDTDAFQTHSVYTGYGTGNVFSANRVEGAWPGYGFGLYPGAANIVECSNSAPGAVKGLVGDNGSPAHCAP